MSDSNADDFWRSRQEADEAAARSDEFGAAGSLITGAGPQGAMIGTAGTSAFDHSSAPHDTPTDLESPYRGTESGNGLAQRDPASAAIPTGDGSASAPLVLRVLAHGVDLVLLLTLVSVFAIVGALAGSTTLALLLGLGGVVLGAIAAVVLRALRGQTPGQMLSGIRVANVTTGTNPSWVDSAIRTVVFTVLAPLLYLPAWLVLADKGPWRRGLHDKLGHSVVIDETADLSSAGFDSGRAPNADNAAETTTVIPAVPAFDPADPDRLDGFAPEESLDGHGDDWEPPSAVDGPAWAGLDSDGLDSDGLDSDGLDSDGDLDREYGGATAGGRARNRGAFSLSGVDPITQAIAIEDSALVQKREDDDASDAQPQSLSRFGPPRFPADQNPADQNPADLAPAAVVASPTYSSPADADADAEAEAGGVADADLPEWARGVVEDEPSVPDPSPRAFTLPDDSEVGTEVIEPVGQSAARRIPRPLAEEPAADEFAPAPIQPGQPGPVTPSDPGPSDPGPSDPGPSDPGLGAPRPPRISPLPPLGGAPVVPPRPSRFGAPGVPDRAGQPPAAWIPPSAPRPVPPVRGTGPSELPTTGIPLPSPPAPTQPAQPAPPSAASTTAFPAAGNQTAGSQAASNQGAPLASGLGPKRPVVVLRLDDGTAIDVFGEGVIGREPASANPDASIHPVADPSFSISKTHMRFGIHRNELWIEDLGSTNGSAIAFRDSWTELTPKRRYAVRAGSIIHIGQRTMKVDEG